MNLNFCITVLSLTMLGIVAMLLSFCYKQELLKMIFQTRTIIRKNEITSEMKIDIDKKESNK